MSDKVVRLTKKGLPDKRSLTSKENISKSRIAVKGALKETYSSKFDSDSETDSETCSDSEVVVEPPKKVVEKKTKLRVSRKDVSRKEGSGDDFQKKLKDKEEELNLEFEKKMKLLKKEKDDEVQAAKRGVIGGMRTKMSCLF